ncbi:MAG: cytochrome c biogenesis protein CcdA [archaeon]
MVKSYGISVVFSLLGVLLSTVLIGVSNDLRLWVSRLGGIIIIVFGLYLLGLLWIGFLNREHKLKAKFSISYVASFVFGAALQ